MSPKIHPSFWSDPDVERLTPNQRYAFLWILTNSQMTLCGYCEVSETRFAFETGLPREELWNTVQALSRTVKGFKDRNLVYVRNFIRRQLGDGEELERNNIFKAVTKVFTGIKHEGLRKELEGDYPAFKALTKGLSTSTKGKEKEQEQEKEQEKEKEKEQRGSAEGDVSKRKPSTLDEVKSYGISQEIPAAECVVFWDKGLSSGWKNDGKPIVDWKATLRNWHRMGYLSPKPANGKPPMPKELFERPSIPDIQ